MSDDGISDDLSEMLDGDVLGEEPGDVDRPATTSYPPERPLGVEDPSLYSDDDLDTREHLRRDLDRADGADHVVLVDVVPEGALDHEAELLADALSGEVADDLPAEEAAVHVIDSGITGGDGDPVD